MAGGRQPPEDRGDDLARLVHATRRMEQAFVSMGKRIHEGQQIQELEIAMLRDLLEAQHRTHEILHQQTRLLADQTRLLRAVLIAVGHPAGHPYPRTTGVTVTPVGG